MSLTSFIGFVVLFCIVNWPKPVLIALGVIFALCFLLLTFSTKKEEDTEHSDHPTQPSPMDSKDQE